MGGEEGRSPKNRGKAGSSDSVSLLEKGEKAMGSSRDSQGEPPVAYVLFLVAMYATCSSTLSVVNKWALLNLPFPGVVTACQFATTAATVWSLGRLRVIDVDPMRLDKLTAMAPINVVFYMAIFTNGQVLKYSTVETFIAFRSLTPLLVSVPVWKSNIQVHFNLRHFERFW